MTRRTYIFDPDLDAMIEITAGSNHPDAPPSGIQIIRDIEPYRTAGSDIAHDNKRIVVGSRSEHRDFLRRNNYVEVGNEHGPNTTLPVRRAGDAVNDIRRALGDFGSNTGARDER
jgi:hypothetical protein